MVRLDTRRHARRSRPLRAGTDPLPTRQSFAAAAVLSPGGTASDDELPDVEWFSPEGTHVDWYSVDASLVCFFGADAEILYRPDDLAAGGIEGTPRHVLIFTTRARCRGGSRFQAPMPSPD